MKDTTIAVDLAKSVFQVAVSHKPGRVEAERRLSREKFLEYLAKQPPATVAVQTMGTPRADIHDGPELVNAPPERLKIRRQSDSVPVLDWRIDDHVAPRAP